MYLQVTDGIFSSLKLVPALQHLHLGHVRLTRERLEELHSEGKSKLTEFTVYGVELTAGSLIALGNYKKLEALALSSCYQVRPSIDYPLDNAKSIQLSQICRGHVEGPLMFLWT